MTDLTKTADPSRPEPSQPETPQSGTPQTETPQHRADVPVDSPSVTATTSSDDAAEGKGRHLGWALVLISIAQLMVVLDATIANIALPFIQRDLDFSQANLSWIVTGYALAFGGLLLLGGRMADLYGRRRIFMIGLVVFAVASALGGIAQSEALLLAARGLQGLGAALASPAALALITTTFPAGPARNRAFAIYAAMSGAGAAVGLILGGWLTGTNLDILGFDVHGWRLTFLINLPIGLIAALLAPRFLPESESHTGELDIPGALTGTLGLLGIVYGLTRAGSKGWDDGYALVSLALGVALLVSFLIIESRVSHPLLPFRIFANRTRAASFVAMMLAPAAMFAMFFYLSQYIQNIMGYSPLQAGLAFLPFSGGIIVAAGLSSSLVSRVDPRWLAGIGTLMASAALYGFSTLPFSTGFPPENLTGSYVTDILPWIVLMSLGMGATFVPLTLTAVHNVGAEDSGIGSGLLNTMQQVGGALGLAILATVFNHIFTTEVRELGASVQQAGASGQNTPEQLKALAAVGGQQIFTHGSTVAFLVGAALMLGASLVVWVFLNVKHQELATEAPEGVVV